jgi:hypothetical protein
MPEVKLQGFVGINSDDEYQMVPQPDTIAGENIVIQSTSEGQNASVKPRLGDTFSFEIPSPILSKKKYIVRALSDTVHIKITGNGGAIIFAEGIGSGPSALEDAGNDLIANLNNRPFLIPGFPYSVYFSVTIITDDQGVYLQITTVTAFILTSDDGQPPIIDDDTPTVDIDSFQSQRVIPDLPVATAVINPNGYYDFEVIAGDSSGYDIVCVSDNIFPSMLGTAKIIGSVDYLGDTFVFSCSENRRPNFFNAFSVSVQRGFIDASGNQLINPSALVQCVNHGLESGDSIDVFVDNSDFVSGNYSITVVDSDSFYLNGYPCDIVYLVDLNYDPSPTVYTGNVTISTNVSSLGEIGVFTKRYDDQEVYIRLLRSPELNFRTFAQIDVEAESTLDKIALYFTDNLNKPRVFYYKGDYIEDGALSFINPLNSYEYGSIDEQLRLVNSTNSISVSFIEQLQSGGNLYAGNKRYVARGLSADFTKGFWSNATSEIPVYSASANELARNIRGNNVGKQTEKANVIEISGINTDIYSYIEIGIIEYLESGYETFILDRIPINGQKTIKYIHSGDGTEKQSVSSQEFNLDNKSIKSALNLSILDNRLLMSNVEYRTEVGLELILSTVTYSLKHYRMPKQGKETALQGSGFAFPSNGITFSEYQRPENVSDYVGYMPNETYLFAARFIFKDGFSSRPIPFITVKFDTNQTSEDGRRVSGLPSFNTVENARYAPDEQKYYDGDLLINHIEFSGFNFGAIVDGSPAYQLIDRIEIMRAVVDSPTVIACGLGVMSVRTGFQVNGGTQYEVVEPNQWIVSGDPLPQIFTEVGYLRSETFTNTLRYPNIVSIYSPDYLFTDRQYQGIDSNTVLIDFGSHQHIPPTDTYVNSFYAGVVSDGSGGYVHFGGNSGENGQGFDFDPVQYQIEEAHNIADGGSYVFNTTTLYDFWFRNYHINNNNQKWLRNLTVKLSSGLPYRDADLLPTLDPDTDDYLVYDKGLRYVQLYKPNPLQYSDIELTNFVDTGAVVRPSDSSVSVFGGDCFLQRTTIKLMALTSGTATYSKPVCVDFYSHNRINSQLRGSDDNIDAMYPSEFANYTAWFNHPFFDELSYSQAYSPRKEGQQKLPYISTLPDDSIQPTTIVYSGTKIRGSVQDSYREFAYSDITSLDTTYGPINFMKAMNGELYTIQDRRIQRQFFNTRGVLSTSDGATALIGDGAAFYRDGVTISTLGTKHKWSVINGRSFGGNDTWYWYDDVNRTIVRFGADGVVPISTRAKFRTILRSITGLARFNYTPADCFGIHGVWNDKLSEAVWVFRLARNYKGIWDVNVDIKEGDVYSYKYRGAGGLSINYPDVFDEIPVLYRAKIDHESSSLNSIVSVDSDLYWSRIEYEDSQYMQFFSVVFSEAQNRFISIDNIYPKIFLKNESDVYYPRTKNPVGAVFKRDSGVPLSFFNYQGEAKLVYGSVESVFNIDPNIQKKAVAIRVNSELVPSQVEVRSENGQTFMIDSDFQGRLDQWDSPVLNNTPDIAGRKNDTGGIFGKYIRVKFIFAPLQLQRLINIVLKFKSVSRNYNT